MKINVIKLKTKYHVFFVASLFVFSAVCVYEKDALAANTFTVITKMQGKAAAKKGVKVELSGTHLNEAITKTTANSGLAKFKEVAEGAYTITATKEGYSYMPEYKEITLAKKKTVTVSFKAVAKVGMDGCIGCHNATHPDVYTAWLKGPHGNFNFYDSATQVNSRYEDFLSSGFTYPTDYKKFIGYPDEVLMAETIKNDPTLAGKTKDYCLNCHGPFSTDNKNAASFPLVNASGKIDTANATQAARPVIGCESCHGGGTNHVNSPSPATIPYKSPDAFQCGQCHNKNFPEGHLTENPAGAGGTGNKGIYEAYKDSAHAKSINESVYTNTKTKEVQALCSKCHTDEGARKYKSTDGDYSTLVAVFDGEKDLSDANAVQCRTCHDAHNGEILLEEATSDRSAQFNTCTNCHQLLDEDGNKITAFHDPAANTETGSDDRIITKNHFDDPATPATFPAEEGAATIEGYNINKNSETACLNCHNPHNADTTINKQWAESGHGDLHGDPWSHYDWKSSSRQACQRCHTATGFANYATDPDTYDATKNDFSYLTGSQEEVLYCNGCHKDSTFSRRTISTVKFPSGKTADLGDDSNLCMACHQGRASKKSVDDAVAAKETGLSFINIHYFAAAALFFGTDVQGGYEFDGKTYAGKNTFDGHSGKKNTCIKCHMREGTAEEPDHHFVPRVTDCSTSGCHSDIKDFEDIRAGSVDYDGDGDTKEGSRREIETLEKALLAKIQSYASATIGTDIVYDGTTNPYFFIDTDGDGEADSDEVTSENAYKIFDATLLKSAYNYQVSRKEPCGYIHNQKYIIQLLIDSIENLGGDVSDDTRP